MPKYLILSLWSGPLLTSDKEEKDDTSKRCMDVMHTKQMSVKLWRKTSSMLAMEMENISQLTITPEKLRYNYFLHVLKYSSF